jgi:hypothetical protein
LSSGTVAADRLELAAIRNQLRERGRVAVAALQKIYAQPSFRPATASTARRGPVATANACFNTIIACVIVLLVLANLMLAFPDLGELIERYGVF